jgi:hypothetical protein
MWDEGDTLPMALGCTACLDREACGGIRKRDGQFSCLDNCCGSPTTCDGMCPNNPVGFLAKMREVNGLALDSLPHATPCPAAALPSYVSYLYHGNRRAVPLDAEAVALPLRLFYRAGGALRFASRAEVEARFGVGPRAGIVLIGSGRDKAIESWWKLSERRAAVLAGLRALGVVLITSPNYSMFTDEVRYNDMHAMKRIGIVWQEIVDAGIPGAYHLNACTSHDYRRLAAFIAERPEVTDVAFEFKTGAAWRKRLPFHLAELAQLANRVGRPLHLVMIGGVPALPVLSAAFARITYIDTSAFMTTMHRQRLYFGNDRKMKKASELTLNGQTLDGLLRENLATMQCRVESLLVRPEG